jgi:hypothetical protein
MSEWSTTALWAGVAASGLYHGLNPGMGWPLAVSAALMGRGRRDLGHALGSLAGGHLLAMMVVVVPFGALIALTEWEREIRTAAGMVVAGFGLYLLAQPRHPKFLARIKPGRLAFWSFAAATAHGAGLMIAPMYLGLCRAAAPRGGALEAAGGLMAANAVTAFNVAAFHTVVMIVAGAVLAFAVFEWMGPRLIGRSWFNLERAWSLSLAGVGAIAIASAWT